MTYNKLLKEIEKKIQEYVDLNNWQGLNTKERELYNNLKNGYKAITGKEYIEQYNCPN